MDLAPLPQPTQENANALASLARSLANELRQQQLRVKEAELRASTARTAEARAKSELAKERAGWKRSKTKWNQYKVKHEALRVKYSRLQALVRREHARRIEEPESPAASEPSPMPAVKNGPATPSSNGRAAQAPPASLPPYSLPPASLPPASLPPASLPPAAAGRPKRGAAAATGKPAEPKRASRRAEPPRHEVVRNKQERAKMDAVTCPECRAFFDAAGGMLSADAMRRIHDDCSRHRVHDAQAQQPSSPENFWRIGFTEDYSEPPIQPPKQPPQQQHGGVELDGLTSSIFDLDFDSERAITTGTATSGRAQRLAGRSFGRKTR